MEYRRLGNTGLVVSGVGFGTIPILKGSVPVLPDYYNLAQDQAVAVMEYAYRLGCNLYDTAIVPEYGDAEIKLGKFAEKIGREKIVISDKARFFDGNGMYRAVEESIENLGTCPDLYFVHQADAEHEEEIFGNCGALDALSELKVQGKIGFVGVASHYYDILLRAAVDPRVDVLQMSGNIFERGMLSRVK
ncbi:MAG: aldo/keto reductase, partial [Lachnospiraceae bacterium]|nr:aldo/keto reductase [Lachnospiraceae bacterium]